MATLYIYATAHMCIEKEIPDEMVEAYYNDDGFGEDSMAVHLIAQEEMENVKVPEGWEINEWEWEI